MQYDPAFVCLRPILADPERGRLHQLARQYPLQRFRQDVRNYEEMAVDFVYTSARIEGNTYDRIDTDNLLRLGVTAGGKRYSDAVMLLNLREGFTRVMGVESSTVLDLDYLADLHKLLMRDLLPAHEQGLVRTSGVQIGGTSYSPPDEPGRLRTEVRAILETACLYEDPFERAIYLHCNLAYLQYFRDGNKRTARLMQTAALVQGGQLPLFFKDTLIDVYQRAVLDYYETGDYSPYVSFFLRNYEQVIDGLRGAPVRPDSAEEAEEMARRLARLSRLQGQEGPAGLFWALTQEALASGLSIEALNWPDIERRTMVQSIARHGHDPAGVAEVLCRYSPGCATAQKQQDLRDDLRRLAPELQALWAAHPQGKPSSP